MQKLFSWFEDNVFIMYSIVSVATSVGSFRKRITHRKNIQNLNSRITHGPNSVCIVQLYALWRNKEQKMIRIKLIIQLKYNHFQARVESNH